MIQQSAVNQTDELELDLKEITVFPESHQVSAGRVRLRVRDRFINCIVWREAPVAQAKELSILQ